MSAAAEQAFATLVSALTKHPDVTPPEPDKRGFGRGALKVNAKLFAFLKGDALVLKLPAARCAALCAAGTGVPFDANKGRPMKEWVKLAGGYAAWPRLSRESLAFVRASSRSTRATRR